jgi:CTP synthase
LWLEKFLKIKIYLLIFWLTNFCKSTKNKCLNLKKLNLPKKAAPDLKNWNTFLHRLKHPKQTVNVGLVGKYVEMQDCYKSILEAFIHAGAANETKVNVISLHSEFIDASNVNEKLAGLDAVLVAPGFGSRGIEGKIHAIQYAREQKVPFFGICLGMQMACVEFARNVLHMQDAHSTEMNAQTQHPVIAMMEEQKNISQMGGTMRLGAFDCELLADSKAAAIYGSTQISERHRHRYEFNNAYLEAFEKNGLVPAGKNPATGLVEIMEDPSHPFYIATQFHPEYKSTVENPHPLFVAFVQAAKQHSSK